MEHDWKQIAHELAEALKVTETALVVIAATSYKADQRTKESALEIARKALSVYCNSL